ncbi:MAG: hypothetical protein ACI8S6_004182 [Myxococcota bacterium]|jgi:hypothetical protein
MKILFKAIIASVMMMSLSAQAQVTGPMYSVNVGGIPLNCRSFAGEPVAIFLNPGLNNIGVASRHNSGAPIIEINPNVINRYSSIVAQWWFAHECAHHAMTPAMNSENNADCFAIRQLRQFGLLQNPTQLQTFYYELSSLPGSSSGHLPGPARVEHITRCALY